MYLCQCGYQEFPWIPKPVNALNSTTANGINDNPSIIYFLKDSKNKDVAKENLEKVAVPYIKSFNDGDGGDDVKQVNFFYHSAEDDGEDIGGSLKNFAKITDQNLVLIDIPEQSVRPCKSFFFFNSQSCSVGVCVCCHE